jgi:hypothetical protein
MQRAYGAGRAHRDHRGFDQKKPISVISVGSIEVHPVEFVYEAPKEHSSGRARDIHAHYHAGITGDYTAISCRSITKDNTLKI